MLKLDNEGYQKSLDWRKQKEAEEAQIAEDQLAEVEAEQHARAETPQTPQWQKRIEEEAEKHLYEIFVHPKKLVNSENSFGENGF